MRLLVLLLLSSAAFAQHEGHEGHGDSHSEATVEASSGTRAPPLFSWPTECGGSFWDSAMAMCQHDPGSKFHLMVHGNSHLTGIFQSGTRGQDGVALPNMLMAHVDRMFGAHQLSLSFMGTLEKFTFPEEGYPLLFQTGEANHHGEPYIDAQHPHSTPVMGLTLSDTIDFGDDTWLRLSFAPRGQSADGPIAFMHRPTAVWNPDAPLGHHLGQDVGHITSTVLSATLRRGSNQVEVAAFNGAEPEPDEIDLPLGKLNSAGVRLTHFFTDEVFAMASIAYVDDPHPHKHGGSGLVAFDQDATSMLRYSLSAYTRHRLRKDMVLFNTAIYGAITTAGIKTERHSFAHELALKRHEAVFYSRFELVQRLPVELNIPSSTPLSTRIVGALSFGYSHELANWQGLAVRAGGAVTGHFVPDDFQAAYGGNTFGAKIFLQLHGGDMFSF
jgi:hypothetical protein